jgi:hypothetical protein
VTPGTQVISEEEEEGEGEEEKKMLMWSWEGCIISCVANYRLISHFKRNIL